MTGASASGDLEKAARLLGGDEVIGLGRERLPQRIRRGRGMGLPQQSRREQPDLSVWSHQGLDPSSRDARVAAVLHEEDERSGRGAPREQGSHSIGRTGGRHGGQHHHKRNGQRSHLPSRP